MPRIAGVIFLWGIASGCFGRSPVSYEGIWQDVQNESSYFILQENGNTVVLIYLLGIEQGANTLKSSYIGSKNDFILTRVSPDVPPVDLLNQVKMEFRSPTEGVVYPKCDTCSVILMRIRKIF
jgi:hypothetical protein